MTTFYITLGAGQPYYPGYFECEARDINTARKLTREALNGRWCGTYRTLEQVHPDDRICRGHIYEDGLELTNGN